MYLIPRMSEISQEAGLKVTILFSYFSIWSHVHYESSKTMMSLAVTGFPIFIPLIISMRKQILY